MEWWNGKLEYVLRKYCPACRNVNLSDEFEPFRMNTFRGSRPMT